MGNCLTLKDQRNYQTQNQSKNAQIEIEGDVQTYLEKPSSAEVQAQREKNAPNSRPQQQIRFKRDNALRNIE